MWCWILILFALTAKADEELRKKLVDPAWKEVLSAGGMHIGNGRVRRFVQLNETQEDAEYEECDLPSGQRGHCRPLRHCLQQVYQNDMVKFMEYLCIIEHKTIGACCPDELTTDDSNGIAGSLPATAPRRETSDLLLKVAQAQNRGCGLSTRPVGRLVGARPANPREWPWVASITPEGYEQYCGGVLITDQHVLTAAHCFQRWKAEKLFVRLGEYDLKRTNDSRSYDFRVIEMKIHEGYDPSSNRHDIAILKLHRPAVFNTYVWPICLPPPGLDLVNQSAVVVGWGTIYYGGPHSSVLMEVGVPLWNHEECVDAFIDRIFEETLCAGGHEGGKDACQGDSGGPLMYQMPSGRWTTIGVVSWGVRCGEPNHPGVFTRVDKYLQWIVDNVKF